MRSLKFMKYVVLGILFFHFSASAAVVANEVSDLPTVLSFKDWKSEKSNTMRARYSSLQTEYLAKKAQNPQDSKLKSLYSDLKNSKSNIDEINELSVSDYFVGYLSRFKDQKKVFQLVAEKLGSAEVAELMNAYAESLLKTSGEGISTGSAVQAPEASK